MKLLPGEWYCRKKNLCPLNGLKVDVLGFHINHHSTKCWFGFSFWLVLVCSLENWTPERIHFYPNVLLNVWINLVFQGFLLFVSVFYLSFSIWNVERAWMWLLNCKIVNGTFLFSLASFLNTATNNKKIGISVEVLSHW